MNRMAEIINGTVAVKTVKAMKIAGGAGTYTVVTNS